MLEDSRCLLTEIKLKINKSCLGDWCLRVNSALKGPTAIKTEKKLSLLARKSLLRMTGRLKVFAKVFWRENCPWKKKSALLNCV